MKSLRAWSDAKQQEDSEKTNRDAEDVTCLAEIELGLNDLITQLIAGLSLYKTAQFQSQQNMNIRRWVVEQGGMLRSTIDDQTEKIRSTLLNSLAQAVGPLLADAIEKKAMTDFCNALETVANKALLSKTIVSVPNRMNSLICEELQRRGLEVKVERSNREELSVEVNDSRIETRISSVLSELDGILQQ